MRIAFVVNTFPPRPGGLEQHVGNLVDGLSDLGHEVHVLTLGETAESRRLKSNVILRRGIAHFPISDVISFPAFGSMRKIAKYLQQHSIDVVSVHTRFFPMTFIGLRAAHSVGIPVVLTEHGAGFVSTKSPLIWVGSRLVDLTIGRFSLARADRVLAVSAESRDFARSLGAHSPQLFLNAILASRGPSTGTRDRRTHLVFVGRMVPGKGWDTFLDLVYALRRDGMDVDGEMLGDGEDLPRVYERVDDLALTDVVSVRGLGSQSEVRSALRGSTLIYCSRLAEGFGIVLLEAVAEHGRAVAFPGPGSTLLASQGLPVVLTQRSDLPSLKRAVERYLADPPPPATDEQIAPWTWQRRSAEYSRILNEVVVGQARFWS